MRYLFTFLQHLSMSSDENLMDPYNLAICFGPTLVPIPTDRDQVQYQNMVNELIKNFIIFNEDIFPNDGLGTVYEKYISSEPDFIGEYDNEDTVMVHDDEDEHEVTDDDSVFREEGNEGIKDISIDCFGKSEMLEATAQYDFTARSSREVSFTKGSTILLYCQVSSDWWRGCVDGREGLVPDKYILIKISGEDDPRDSLASISEGLERRRISSQTDTLRSTRSEQSPRFRRPHHSVSAPPDTPPLTRSQPHRHSISHTPGSHVVPQTVIAVQTQCRPRSPSRDSLEQDSGIPESEVTRSERSSRSQSGLGSESDYRSLEPDSLSVDETADVLNNDNKEVREGIATIHADTSSGTTVIHVSGGPSSMLAFNKDIPDRDKDDKDREAFETEEPGFGISLGEGQGRNESICDNSSSQDSLASSGSNEKLKSELENTLACVRAVVEEVVGEKEKPFSEELVDEIINLPSGSRHGIGRKMPCIEGEPLNSDRLLGARPRVPTATPRTSKSMSGDQEGILLKQSSWGSRFGLKEEPSEESNNSSFIKRKDLWERRTISTPTNNEEDGVSGFRGNREFWKSKSSPRSQKPPAQAPDLVRDLPTGLLASSPPIPAPRPIHFRRSRSPSSDSLASNLSSSPQSPTRNSVSLTTADNFAADTDTLKKTQAAQHSKPSASQQPSPHQPVLHQTPRPHSQVISIQSPGPRTPTHFSTGLVASPQTPFSRQPGSFKPAVKVKPILQVKPSEVKKGPPKESE